MCVCSRWLGFSQQCSLCLSLTYPPIGHVHKSGKRWRNWSYYGSSEGLEMCEWQRSQLPTVVFNAKHNQQQPTQQRRQWRKNVHSFFSFFSLFLLTHKTHQLKCIERAQTKEGKPHVHLVRLLFGADELDIERHPTRHV